MRRFSWLVLIAISVSQTAIAMQVKSVADNDMTQATISASELSRISIKDDRILSVLGVDGAYTFNADEEVGAIYIKPNAAYRSRPFSVHVTTENKHHYRLLLTPAEVPSESIILIGSTVNSQDATANLQRATSYTDTITHLVKAMYWKKALPGYTVSQNELKVNPTAEGLVKEKVRLYQGEQLLGSEYRLWNHTKQDKQLIPDIFYHRGVKAIAIDKWFLPAGGTTRLYLIESTQQGGQ